MSLTTDELKAKLVEQLSKADPKDPGAPVQVVGDFLKWCFENLDSLDENAKRYIETSFAKVTAEMRKSVDQLLDSPTKREIAR